MGTFALTQLVVGAGVAAPVIAAGGIADTARHSR